AVEASTKAYADLSEQIAATMKELQGQVAAVSTTEEWAESVNNLTRKYNEAKNALQAFKAEQAKKNGVAEFFRDQFVTDYKTKKAGSLSQLENAIPAIASLRDSQIERVNNTGLTDREKDQFKLDIQQRESLREQKFQQDFGNADAEKQNRLAEEHIALLKREAAEGKAAEDARNKFDRSDSGKERTRADIGLTDAKADEEQAKARARAAGLTDDQFGNPAELAAQLRRQATELDPRTGFGGKFSASGPAPSGEAVAKLRAQAAALEELNAATAKQKELTDRLASIRRGPSADELTRNLQEQADIRSAIRTAPAASGVADPRNSRLVALQRRAIEINESIGSFRGKEAAAQQESAGLVEAKKIQALKETEIALDREIAAARQAGLETASLEMQRQITLLEKQRSLAANRPQEQRAIDAQLADVRSRQAQFRGNVALDREQDRLRIKGDGRGVQAIDDFKNLRDLTAQYLANGLTAKQAKADFDRNLIARGAGGPPVSVDALQAVGGGGGSSSFGGASIELQRRQTTLTEQMVQYLREIAQKGARGDSGID
ncbi:MAG: hypothetical protein ABIR80_05420, partial [Opitutaceae bacterium]